MEKKLSDYLYLYIGADIECVNPECSGDMEYHGMRRKVSHLLIDKYLNGNWKPILRRLDSMTEEDIDLGDFIPEFEIHKQVANNNYWMEIDSVNDWGYCLRIYKDGSMECECKDNGEFYPYNGAELFRQLLSKHFDLFGLIKNNLAIDAATLNPSHNER